MNTKKPTLPTCSVVNAQDHIYLNTIPVKFIVKPNRRNKYTHATLQAPCSFDKQPKVLEPSQQRKPMQVTNE